MICPECGSAIIIQSPTSIDTTSGNEVKNYRHNCMRCFAIINIQVTIESKGNPELVKKYREWLNEGRSE